MELIIDNLFLHILSEDNVFNLYNVLNIHYLKKAKTMMTLEQLKSNPQLLKHFLESDASQYIQDMTAENVWKLNFVNALIHTLKTFNVDLENIDTDCELLLSPAFFEKLETACIKNSNQLSDKSIKKMKKKLKKEGVSKDSRKHLISQFKQIAAFTGPNASQSHHELVEMSLDFYKQLGLETITLFDLDEFESNCLNPESSSDNLVLFSVLKQSLIALFGEDKMFDKSLAKISNLLSNHKEKDGTLLMLETSENSYFSSNLFLHDGLKPELNVLFISRYDTSSPFLIIKNNESMQIKKSLKKNDWESQYNFNWMNFILIFKQHLIQMHKHCGQPTLELINFLKNHQLKTQ